MAKKKAGQHLKFYIGCMNNNCEMPYWAFTPSYGGLCSMAEKGIISNELFELFSYGRKASIYWAEGGTMAEKGAFAFTPLRQTIVLFMACLNGEL